MCSIRPCWVTCHAPARPTCTRAWGWAQCARLSGFPLLKHPQVRKWLGPFILACSVYFLLWIPKEQPSWVSALVKCLPLLSLVLFLGAVASGGTYTWLLQGALVCSAIGDACLIWPQAFLHGMAAFAAAHFLYFCAFGLSPLRPGLLLLTVPASVAYYGLLLLHLEPDMILPVGAYTLILNTMLWRSLALGGSASWGALLFTFSDGILAWDTFVQSLPYARLVIMTTYYMAQLLLTLSALQSPGLKTH